MHLNPKTITRLAGVDIDDDRDVVVAVVVIPVPDLGPLDTAIYPPLSAALINAGVAALAPPLTPVREEVVIVLDVDDDSVSPVRYGSDFDPPPAP
jgi:hypothetical protein